MQYNIYIAIGLALLGITGGIFLKIFDEYLKRTAITKATLANGVLLSLAGIACLACIIIALAGASKDGVAEQKPPPNSIQSTHVDPSGKGITPSNPIQASPKLTCAGLDTAAEPSPRRGQMEKICQLSECAGARDGASAITLLQWIDLEERACLPSYRERLRGLDVMSQIRSAYKSFEGKNLPHDRAKHCAVLMEQIVGVIEDVRSSLEKDRLPHENCASQDELDQFFYSLPSLKSP